MKPGQDQKYIDNDGNPVSLSSPSSLNEISWTPEEAARLKANELTREKNRVRNELKNEGLEAAKGAAMQTVGKGAQMTAPLMEKGGEAIGHAAGSAVGGGIGAVGGALGGAVAGAAAGGVGAGPGALAGLKTGLAKGAEIGNKVGGGAGKATGRAAGKTAQAVGRTIEQRGVRKQQESARNIAKNLLSQGGRIIPGLDAGKLAIKETTKAWLNALWAGVWEDPTGLCLLGLNTYLVLSWTFPQMAQFGEDDILGTPLGGGRIAQAAEKFGLDGKNISLFARTIEIILLLVADVIILLILILVIYIFYQLYQQFMANKLSATLNVILNSMTAGMSGTAADLFNRLRN